MYFPGTQSLTFENSLSITGHSTVLDKMAYKGGVLDKIKQIIQLIEILRYIVTPLPPLSFRAVSKSLLNVKQVYL